jgi:ABC-type multidrug transport system fused ATPase/permease subunit
MASLAQASGVAESVRLAEEVHVFGAGQDERARIDSLIRSLELNFVRTRTLSATVPVLYQSAVMLLLIAGLALLYLMGSTRLASLGAAVLLLIRASSYGQQLQTAYQGLGESLPYLDRMIQAVKRYRAARRRMGLRPLGALRTMEFDSVSFAYTRGARVLRNVSFSIGAGETIGIVGPTGAGKSTILQILLRLREPLGGSYLVNRLPANEFMDSVWHQKVSYLPQEPHLLNASVTENIRFFREWIDHDAVEHAAQLAQIHGDIVSWVDGYETIVGHGMNAVSGGQRQRLCLARALAGSPELLLLDEPTSSLDLQSERLIQQSLQELRGSLTMIVVAHRLTTLSPCDRVMVIRDGSVESFASPRDLYISNGFYRRVVDLASASDSTLSSK